MKNKLASLFLLLICFVTAMSCQLKKKNAGEVQPSQPEVVMVNDGIRFCESTYPYKGGILIANFGTEQLNPLNTEGKGYIVFYKEGKTETLIPADGNLSAPKGMFVRDEYLFVCDVNKIVVYNLRNLQESPQVIGLPQGDLFVNDLAAEGNTLYASVTNSGKIYSMDISNPATVGAPIEWLSIAGPNGLIIDNGSMYIASYPADGNTTDANVIYQISDLANPAPQKFITHSGQYDGIGLSADKKTMYITNWVPAQVAAVDMETRKIIPLTIELTEPLVGPADISIAGEAMYIPDLPNSRVLIYSLD